MLAILLCLLAALAFRGAQAGSSHEYRLRAELSRRYDDIRRNMVPGQDQGLSPLRLSFEMMAIKIMEFDEDKDIIRLYGWNRMRWTDVNLSWEEEDYGGISTLRLPNELMWRPDIVLYNSLQLGSGQDESVHTVVFSNGTILFVPPALNKVYCDRSTSGDNDDDHDHGSDSDHHHGSDSRGDDDNPEWTCSFKFGSWVYDGNTVNPEVYNNGTSIDTSMFIPDQKYEVISTDAKVNIKYYPCCAEPYPDITFTMRIRRK